VTANMTACRTNCHARHARTQKPRHHNTTEKFVVVILLHKLQFILKIKYITVVIRIDGIF